MAPMGFQGPNSNPDTRIITPYDSHIGNNIRLDIAGGIGLSGRLEDCSVCEHGYSFSLKPAIIYGPNQLPQIETERSSQITSNGSPVSIIPINDDLEAYANEIIDAKREMDRPSGQSSGLILLPPYF
jgi:hypothetical protein